MSSNLTLPPENLSGGTEVATAGLTTDGYMLASDAVHSEGFITIKTSGVYLTMRK